MPIEPRIPHNDLVVTHEIVEGEQAKYITTLKEPDGTTVAMIGFHKGSPVEGWHGWTTAHVITALIKHMEYHQSTPFACEENERILGHLKAAHAVTEERANERKSRGVLYDSAKP